MSDLTTTDTKIGESEFTAKRRLRGLLLMGVYFGVPIAWYYYNLFSQHFARN